LLPIDLDDFIANVPTAAKMLNDIKPTKVLDNGDIVDKYAPVANGEVAEAADLGFNMTEYMEVLEYLNSTRHDSFMGERMGDNATIGKMLTLDSMVR
jgi:hypothetical protein